MAGYPYQGLYPPFGFSPRNRPVDIPAKNPLEANPMHADTGDAGQDGYSVLSRANRYDGERSDVGGYPEFQGPNLED